MAKREKPEALEDDALDQAKGGGLLPDPFGVVQGTPGRGTATPYIGETEKNIAKAPAGVTHDKAFED